ncbi:unnamed protein product [Paramecium octaurelia]|uniref:Uncharacterized protein n=1 Tax=Paramecium octaurelia TaxID=43137 RepID=A0A8S1V039_PAROT|nr:unnamed protein product [Paramecium octaurelia]
MHGCQYKATIVWQQLLQERQGQVQAKNVLFDNNKFWDVTQDSTQSNMKYKQQNQGKYHENLHKLYNLLQQQVKQRKFELKPLNVVNNHLHQ